MPQIPAAIIAALISAGAGGLTTGLEASGVIGGGGGPSTPAAPTPDQIAQRRAQLANLVRQNAGNVQESTSGGASPNFLAEVTGQNTGTLNSLSTLQDIASGAYGGSNPGASSPNMGAVMPTDLSITPNTRPTLSGEGGLTDLSIFG